VCRKQILRHSGVISVSGRQRDEADGAAVFRAACNTRRNGRALAAMI